MGDIVQTRNIGQLGDLVRATDHGTQVAAGSGDGTTITGLTIDREGFGNGSLPDSALFGVLFEATLASGATESIGYAVQDSPDNSVWTDYQTAAAAVAATGPSGGGAVKGSFNVQVNLTSANRYVRFNYKPDLSAAGTDTAFSDGVGFVAGFDRLASPN